MIRIRDFYQRFELAGNIWKGMWECFEFLNIGQPSICGFYDHISCNFLPFDPLVHARFVLAYPPPLPSPSLPRFYKNFMERSNLI